MTLQTPRQCTLSPSDSHEESEITDASVVFGTVNLNIGGGYDEFTGKDKSKDSIQLIILCLWSTKLREGNVFTGACLSTGREWGIYGAWSLPGPWSHGLSGGGYLWSRVPSGSGRVSLVPCLFQGGRISRVYLPPKNNKSGQYTSYLNAFLFVSFVSLLWIIIKSTRIHN